MRAAEIAVFVLNLSDIIFLRTAPHTCWPSHSVRQQSKLFQTLIARFIKFYW